MVESALYGGLLRFYQALLLSAPTILVSLFVAAVFFRLFSREVTRRIFGGTGWRSLVQSWAIGMLLPGCSLGVIPISRELRYAGLSGGAVLAFALSQPLFDPLSLLYGLTLSRPFVIFAFAGCSLFLVMAVGTLWDWIYPDTAEPVLPSTNVVAGWPRMASVLLSMVRDAGGWTMGYVTVGLLGTSLLAVCLPSGSLQRAMNGGNPWAPATMTLVAIPAYATPTMAMGQLGSMFQHGNSAGAALQLLTLGAGLNAGLIAWMIGTYGWRKLCVWFAMLIAVSLGIAYAIDGPMQPKDIFPADHTHAFDIYCSPFPTFDEKPALHFVQRAQQSTTTAQLMPLALLGVFVVLGIGVNLLDPRQALEAWLESRQRSTAMSSYDVAIPGPVLGLCVVGGIMAVSVAGCFAYYPERNEVFREIAIVRAEANAAARKGDSRLTDNYMAQWDTWTRRLEVGVLLRDWHVSRYQSMKGRVLREKMELLRHAVEDKDEAEIKPCLMKMFEADRRFREAFGQ